MQRRFLIFFLLLGLLTIYTGIHAQHLSSTRPWLGWVTIFAFVGLMVYWQRVHRTDQSDPNSWRYRLLAWSGTFAMGIWATFLFFCLTVDLLSLFLLIIQVVSHGALRFSVLSLEGMSLFLIVVSAMFAALGLLEAIGGPRVVRVTVPIAHLPEALRGFKIALLSDLHIGPTIGARYVTDVVERTNALAPDLIAVTGDLGDETVDHLESQTAPLADLTAPQGTFYVTGNHEYYWGPEEWLTKIRSLGWLALLNDNRIIQVKGSSILVGGITDSAGEDLPGHKPDINAAARGGEKSDVRLLLSHRPGVYAEAEQAGFDLQLSGHTHGGQFFPWSLVIPFVHRFYKDLNRFRKLWVYVSPGTGYWGPPHRFLVPSEITLLELIPAS